ncbi:hypothetical protein [Alkalihalobacterium elongatum]|uniref:hypothetical protein n=1 Tax=Alkalihalobacterium elongatum TaxID=2675466 RepID=UPI001C1FC30F|nr:hypothetical protein [Alkalihalobacterium elongatum]
MALQKHHKQMAVFLFWSGSILYFIGLIVLFYGTQGISLDKILIYFITFGLGTITLLLAYWRVKQMNETASQMDTVVNTEEFFKARRLMFVSSVSLREPYTFYTLDGNVVAKFQEEVMSAQQFLRLIVNIVFPFNVFPLVMYLKAGKRTLTVEKRGGFFRPFEVYDEHRKLLGKFELGKKIIARYTLNIFDEKGQYLANINDVSTQSAYTVKLKDEKEAMFIRIGGIPTEALQLFGTIEGDIVDIEREHLTEEEFLLMIITPLIIKYTTAR